MKGTIVAVNRKYAGRSTNTRACFGGRMPRRPLAHVLNHGGALICNRKAFHRAGDIAGLLVSTAGREPTKTERTAAALR